MISCPYFTAELHREKTLYWCCRRHGITKTEPQHYIAFKKDHKLSHCADMGLMEDVKRFTDR